jgi:hypothetical protein
MLKTCPIERKEYHHSNSEVFEELQTCSDREMALHTTSLGNAELSRQRIQYYHQCIFRIRAGQNLYTYLNIYNWAIGRAVMLQPGCGSQE